MCAIIEHTIEICELADWQTPMCIPTKLQQNIVSLTKDGHAIAKFLVSTMQGETPGVKVNHRLEAAKHLIKYGFPDTDCGNIPPHPQEEGESPVQSPLSPRERARVRGTENTPSPSTGEGWDGGDNPTHPVHPVSHLDILNYETAHLIRHETAEGHTIVNFLVDMMTGRDRPFTPKKFRIKPADRMAAARELLRRGFGDFGSRRKLSDTNDKADAYDTLHTDLAKRMREYSERGTDTIRFLLELMSDPDPDKEFTVHHRVYAAQELLRRGWDTNYDAVKPEHLQDYWQDKESTRLSVGQKKTLAGLPTSIDDYDQYDDTDYEAISKEMREEEDHEAAAAPKSLPPRREKSLPPAKAGVRMGVNIPAHSALNEDNSSAIRHSRAGGNPEGWGEGTKSAEPFVPSQPNEPAPAKAEAEAIRKSNNTEDKNLYDYGSNDHDPTADYYFEPLNPDDQAIFDYQVLIETGGFSKGEVPKEPTNPPTSAYAEYSDTLRRIREAAVREGVPVLPNPLAGTLRKPTIRSP